MQAKEEVIFIIIVVIILLIFFAIMFLVFLTKNNMRKNRLVYENERIRKEFQAVLLKTKLEIQESTLDYVSREIHDNIGQTLTLARLQLNNNDEIQNRETTDNLIGRAISDLRTLSHSLNTNHFKEKGFRDSLALLINQYQKTGRFRIDYKESENGIDLDDEKGLIVFRVIQEVLNNITKHAEATEIRIETDDKNNQSSIQIADNGKGFNLNEGTQNGIGLKNIKDRIELIGGKFSITSALNKGTIVKLTLPHES